MPLTIDDAYTAIPIRYSEEDSEWLIQTDYSGYRNFLRCDCHDAFWHWAEVHYVDASTEDETGELILCDLPFFAWPDHPYYLTQGRIK